MKILSQDEDTLEILFFYDFEGNFGPIICLNLWCYYFGAIFIHFQTIWTVLLHFIEKYRHKMLSLVVCSTHHHFTFIRNVLVIPNICLKNYLQYLFAEIGIFCRVVGWPTIQWIEKWETTLISVTNYNYYSFGIYSWYNW